jgi:hypothetical protein
MLNEIIEEICNKITSVRSLINYGSVNKQHILVIKSKPWLHVLIQLKSDDMINLMLENYKFGNISLRYTLVTDKGIEKLINAHSLDLHLCTNITDESVSKLINLYKLNISHTYITDKSISQLSNIQNLNISWCTMITDNSISKLINVRDLTIYCYNYISDQSILKLTNLQTLRIFGNKLTEETKKRLKEKGINLY